LQFLYFLWRTDREDEPPTAGQLFTKYERDFLRSAGTENGIEASLRFWPGQKPVSLDEADIVEAKPSEVFSSEGHERALQFHGADFPGEDGKNGRLIAAAGADLEHPLTPLQGEQFAHAGHHVRLGNRLIAPNGQGVILIRTLAEIVRNKLVTRKLRHRLENALILNTTTHELLSDHLLPGGRAILFSGSKHELNC